MESVSGPAPTACSAPWSARGDAAAGDRAWLQAMLDAEAAGQGGGTGRSGRAGSGAAVTAVARADLIDADALSRAAAGPGHPFPHWSGR